MLRHRLQFADALLRIDERNMSSLVWHFCISVNRVCMVALRVPYFGINTALTTAYESRRRASGYRVTEFVQHLKSAIVRTYREAALVDIRSFVIRRKHLEAAHQTDNHIHRTSGLGRRLPTRVRPGNDCLLLRPSHENGECRIWAAPVVKRLFI